MLGVDERSMLVPRWPSNPDAKVAVWSADDPSTVAYHWAPLTSGSRWFVLWPLLLPFTLLNAAGYMVAGGSVVGRVLHRVLCATATVWFASWLLLGGQGSLSTPASTRGSASPVPASSSGWSLGPPGSNTAGLGTRRARRAAAMHRA
ncbi:MAG: hypothetical protein R2701_01220 [Acidimicrobiales bacterium]